MTVAELIDVLKKFDQNLPVLTPGFDESGFECIDVWVRRMAEYSAGRSRKSSDTYIDVFSDDRSLAGQTFDALIIDYKMDL